MAKGGKKKKTQEQKTLSIVEFLKLEGNEELPVFKEIMVDGEIKKINISEIPSAPQSSFEIVIKPHILKSGSPYYLVARNIPFDSTEDQLKEFLECLTAVIEFQFEDGRPKGIAIIAIESLDKYKSALEKDGMKMGFRPVYVSQGKVIPQIDERSNIKDRSKYSSNFGTPGSGNFAMGACSASDANWRSEKEPTLGIIRNSQGSNIDNSNWRNNNQTPESDSNWRNNSKISETENSNWRSTSKISETDNSNWRSTSKISETDSGSWRSSSKVSETDNSNGGNSYQNSTPSNPTYISRQNMHDDGKNNRFNDNSRMKTLNHGFGNFRDANKQDNKGSPLLLNKNRFDFYKKKGDQPHSSFIPHAS